MLKLCVALLICDLALSATARKCNILSPRCLHMKFEDRPKLTKTCNNECELEEILALHNGTKYETFRGRCFNKRCDPDDVIVNTGTPLCVHFLSGEPRNFDSESDLNEYLCNNADQEVSSIPGSSKC